MDLMNKRTPLIGGNWKMYKDPAGTTSFFERFLQLVERSAHCEIECQNAVKTGGRKGTLKLDARWLCFDGVLTILVLH
jgi:hypothetical protein